VQTLVLWDIDHTLIELTGLSKEIYASAFAEITGRRLDHLAPMAGRTDLAITAETLRLHGLTPSNERLRAFGDALASGFAAREHEIRDRGRVLPGAQLALTGLAARTGVVQSVLTGNMVEIAIAKLRAFGLDSFVDFEAGAYGFDHSDRPPLVAMARERAARKYGVTFDRASTVLVGDTVHDVEAGHQGGARVIAVATGSSDQQMLRAAGAEIVLADLCQTAEVIQAILGATRLNPGHEVTRVQIDSDGTT
jgi:phosphoglycolate phosphatase-like HAD superfamily hydrolase